MKSRPTTLLVTFVAIIFATVCLHWGVRRKLPQPIPILRAKVNYMKAQSLCRLPISLDTMEQNSGRAYIRSGRPTRNTIRK
jgi:hypothetical protein